LKIAALKINNLNDRFLGAFSSACPGARHGAKGASAAGQGSNLPIWGTSPCYEEIASAKSTSQ
jgi:hypothetical protein